MFKRIIGRCVLQILIILILIGGELACAGEFKHRFASPGEDSSVEETVVGRIRAHTVAPKETLLDIARDYGLGFNEIQILYPEIDPWIPEPGLRLSIPTRWILPSTKYQGVVINLPELRLYRFFPRIGMVKTYPVGIGDLGRETPEGIYRVVECEVRPTWVIPHSLREKDGITRVPPGPNNPLGKYWIRLSRKGYGIHGTNFPWGVGRLVSHGCIRLYPEHIAELFKEVAIGTPVEIIYEPVKIGVKRKEIFLEVHPDLYGRVMDMKEYTRNRLQELGLRDYISIEEVKVALQKHDGVPVRVGTMKKGGDRAMAQEAVDPLRWMDSFDQLDKEVTR